MEIASNEMALPAVGETARGGRTSRRGRAGGRRFQGAGLAFSRCLDAIYRRKWWILGGVLLALGIAELAARLRPPMFEAVSTLIVERDDSRSPADRERLLDMHVRDLQSAAALALAGAGAGHRTPSADALEIRRAANSCVIQVVYEDADPARAAGIANAVAAAYIEQLRKNRETEWRQVSAGEQRRVEELRRRMEESAKALAGFAGEDAGDPERRSSELEARLSQLSVELDSARMDTRVKLAALAPLRAGVEKLTEQSAPGQELCRLVRRRNEARQKFAQTKSIYGDRHPEYQRAETALRDSAHDLDAAYSAAVKRADAELASARRREAELTVSHGSLLARAEAESLRAVEYHLARERADADRAMFEGLAGAVHDAEIDSAVRSVPVRVSSPAGVPVKRGGANRPLYRGIALLGSLLLGCALAIAREPRNSLVATPEEAAEASRMATVVAVPAVEAWRGLRGVRMFAGDDAPVDTDIARFRSAMDRICGSLTGLGRIQLLSCIAVVGPGEGDGRSRVAAELARSFVGAGESVLLVDANLRNPVLHFLHSPAEPGTGLAKVLAGTAGWEDAPLRSAGPGVPDVLPAGVPDAGGPALPGARLCEVVERALERYDRVILDSPAFLKFPEALDIARCADACVVVARAGVTRAGELAATLRYLNRLNAGVAALVLNGAEPANHLPGGTAGLNATASSG